jgi:hypothetical protein
MSLGRPRAARVAIWAVVARNTRAQSVSAHGVSRNANGARCEQGIAHCRWPGAVRRERDAHAPLCCALTGDRTDMLREFWLRNGTSLKQLSPRKS